MKKVQNYTRPRIGRILLDGGFLSQQDLARALKEQNRTNELLGQVLVRMGILDSADIKAALSVQSHLGRIEDAVRIAAGARRKLGELLVQSGRITQSQLDQALVEQKRTGEKLGEVFIRLGLLTEQQLNGLLDFQRIQGAASPLPGPLKLGEILVSTGCISRLQLDNALRKQTIAGKKLGEVLIEEGYAQPHHVKQGIRLQHMLIAAVLAALLTACGGSGGGSNAGINIASAPTNTSESSVSVSSNYFEISSSDFNILKPDFYYSTDNVRFWSIQAAVARDVWDDNYQCIVRIDIQKTETGEMPAINKTFSIEASDLYEQFPGTFLVFNGAKSTNKKVEQGILSFTPDSTADGLVRGSFDVTLTDYDSPDASAPRYHLKGTFSFIMGTYGPADSAPAANN
jgi:hypothetical protein